jgi:pimeloyl-ACP methyl ester carboxylesterase
MTQIAHTALGDIEYRAEGKDGPSVLILNGGHMDASIALGEDFFTSRGYSILVVSRPGYGGTPLNTGTTPDGFADVLSELFDQLKMQQAIVVGISSGGRTAMRFAAKYPDKVQKLILQSANSFASWPDLKTRLIAYIAFNPFTEKYTWQYTHSSLDKNPKAAMKMLFSGLSDMDFEKLVSKLTAEQFETLKQIFMHFRSKHGFMNDLKGIGGDACDVRVPTLIVHSKHDGSVPLSHPKLLSTQIQGSTLYLTDTESHMIWFSKHYPDVEKVMDEFLGE